MSLPNRWQRVARAVLALAALGFVLLTTAILLSREWWAFDLLTHFRRQYVLALFVLIPAALLARAWGSGAIFASLMLFHGWVLFFPQGASVSAIEGGRQLRITIMNVHYANGNRTAVLDYVRSVNPDILIVEEAWADNWADTRREIASLFPAQAPQGLQSKSIPFVFSRHPITAFTTLWPLNEPFGLLRAEIDVGVNRLTVLALHPPYPMTRRFFDLRNAHFAAVAEAAGQLGTPLVAAGDFNVTPWSPHYLEMLRGGGLRNAAGNAAALSTWPTWFWPAGIPIDHLLTKGAVSVSGVARGPDIGSDHYPLTVDLVVGR